MRSNDDYIESCYRNHRGLFLKRAYAVSGDFVDAEEIVQEAFFEFIRQIRRRPDLVIESEGHCNAMMYNQVNWGIAKFYQSKDRLSSIKEKYSCVSEEYAEIENRVDTYPLGGILMKNLDRLPEENQRQAIKANIIHDLCHKEIELVYGIPEAQVGVIKKLGYKRLKKNHFGNDRLKASFPAERNWTIPDKCLGNLNRPVFTEETMKIVSLRKEGLSNKQISEHLNLSTDKIKNRYSHYIKKLANSN